MSNLIIRQFLPKDREALRTICCDTADMGEPIEHFFPERESAADLLTAYYTDFEPESTFVAELDEKILQFEEQVVRDFLTLERAQFLALHHHQLLEHRPDYERVERI